ncbi:DUF1565 domain-containing protein [Mastigocoleus testarum]|uniref:Carbohydrate-binding/sugar hydrolysis domain-containing protein n=1 Tax=Mastigocoleus testarum BC008 TaxID=371196 RepID=A0A0V7ZLZ3_9CYAN|nr:DUF1565 domain-containing protein [Mastigocoleus testarum]KST65500.1 hypothetical protein BC008_41975 [Mastigocoleus testarum BC008]
MNHTQFISQLVFKYFRQQLPKNYLFSRDERKAKSFNLEMFSVLNWFVLYLSASIGVGVTICLTLGFAQAVAQLPPTPSTRKTDVRSISQVNVLFVNPRAGNDTGDGSSAAPLQTITKALEIAKSNTVIRLSEGNYSESSGEKFPLFLKSGVTITGEENSGGRGIVIMGGGEFLSRAFGSKNVAVVGANKAVLSGVTVTNNNPRGYGLWIESSNPTITGNTFTGSTQDGVAITGNSAAQVSKNYFYRNGANGITITGNSKAEVQNNVFQHTGFGINIAASAEPVVLGNQIKFNRSGIIVQADARPILRNNIIENSKEDGLVVISQAQPNLGDSNEAGGNQFRGNARHDINAKAAKQQIVAVGNIIRQDRVDGDVVVRTGSLPIARPSNLPSTIARPLNFPSNNTNLSRRQGQNSLKREVTFSAPRSPAPNLPPKPLIFNSPQRQANPLPRANVTNNRSELPQINSVQIDKNTIEFRAPSPNSNSPLPLPNQQLPSQPKGNPNQGLPALKAASPDILSVPNPNVPLGSNSGTQQLIPPPNINNNRNRNNIETPSTVAIREAPTSSRYRVFVEVRNLRDRDLVKYLAPGAFLRQWRGRSAMQAGVFSAHSKAKALVKIFKNNGLRATVEPIKR